MIAFLFCSLRFSPSCCALAATCQGRITTPVSALTLLTSDEKSVCFWLTDWRSTLTPAFSSTGVIASASPVEYEVWSSTSITALGLRLSTMYCASCGPCTSSRGTTRKNVGNEPFFVRSVAVAEPATAGSPARVICEPIALTSWLPAGPTIATILSFATNCRVTVNAWAGCSCVSPWTTAIFVLFFALSWSTASWAKCSCSPPSWATCPVIGASTPICAVQLAFACLDPELLAFEPLSSLLPHAATPSASAGSARHVATCQAFIICSPSSGSWASCHVPRGSSLRRCARVRGRAVGVVRGGGRARGAEHGHDLHDVRAGVLQAMHRASGEMDAGSRPQRRRFAVHAHHALAGEDVDHLVVEVHVVGRAGRRDVADEVRRRAQPAGRIGDDPELPLGRGRLRFLVGEPAHDRPLAGGGLRRRGVGDRHRHEPQRRIAGVAQLVALAGREVGAGFGLERVLGAAEAQAPATREDEEDLLAPTGVARRGASGRKLEHVLLEHRAADVWAERRARRQRRYAQLGDDAAGHRINRASCAISVPASANETGHVLARSASCWNSASSAPGPSPSVLSVMLVIRNPSGRCSSRTRAVVRSSVGGCPASVSLSASDMVKQPASAAPMSSSGFALGWPSSTRALSVNGPSNAPLPSPSRPPPSSTVPLQLAWAVRMIPKLMM